MDYVVGAIAGSVITALMIYLAMQFNAWRWNRHEDRDCDRIQQHRS